MLKIINNNVTSPKLVVSKKEYDQMSPEEQSRHCCKDTGSSGHFFHKYSNGLNLGVYTPRKGFYKIIEVPDFFIYGSGKYFDKEGYTKSYKLDVTTNKDSERIINKPLYVYYSALDVNSFAEEVILIDAKPLFNLVSKGPMVVFKEGMILQVKEDVVIENGSYKIVWDVLT